MNNQHFQVIVVGSGPAGAAAAYTLAKSGISVCLLDRRTFPRDKLCGGLISGRSKTALKEIFGLGLSNDLFLACSNISFYSNDLHLADVDGLYENHLTMRFDFDNHLHELAVEAGAIAVLGHATKSIDLAGKSVSLTNGDIYAFDFLVGADGVNSAVAKSLYGRAFDPENIGFALEVEVPRDAAPHMKTRLSLDLSAASWGYGWVFPKTNSFTVGIGGTHALNGDMNGKMDAYLRLNDLDPDDYKYKGHYIPWGAFRKTPGQNRVFLCGDAAGLVDPISGEGIAYALLSGQAAAVSILHAVSANKPDEAFPIYQKKYLKITSSIRQANFWRNFIFPDIMQKVVRKFFGDAATLQHGYLEILEGKREYSALPGLFLLQLWYALTRPFRWK